MEDFIPIIAILVCVGGPIAIFLALILGPGYYRDRERARLQETLRKAIDAGQSLPVEVIDAVAKASETLPTRTRDFRRAVILLAIAGAFTTMGFIADFYSFDDHANGAGVLWGIATIPGFVGLAFLALGLTSKAKA